MIDGFVALLGGGDGDLKPLLDLGLAGEVGENRRTQRHFERGIGLGQNIRNYPLRHTKKDGERFPKRQGEKPMRPKFGLRNAKKALATRICLWQ